MFGHKNAGLQETVLRSRERDDAAKSTQTRRKTETWIAKTPFDDHARKETYFAVAAAFRWNQ